jgi:hypothetical protein
MSSLSRSSARSGGELDRSSLTYRHLGKLQRGCADVKFRVAGGEMFKAHRNIFVCRSLVFNSELFGPMGELGRCHGCRGDR